MTKKLNVINMGKKEYKEALDIQFELVKLRQENRIDDLMLIVEHPPVITVGRSGDKNNIIIPAKLLEKEGISVFEVNRGGDVTYHGPGQIVGYPILNLNNFGRDVKKYVRMLEQTFIDLLREEYEIIGGRDPEYIGVWVGNEKITAIGVAVKRWVTMHGFAFNVNTNLSHFHFITPCGITDTAKGVTSLKKLTGREYHMDKVSDKVAGYFCRQIGSSPHYVSLQSVLQSVLKGVPKSLKE